MIDYLRISLTDRCNLRCSYCIPKVGMSLHSHDQLLSFEEILYLTRVFAKSGIKKIRLTGGEPLVRNGVIDLIGQLKSLEGIEEVSLTTNGVLLPIYARGLKEAGIKNINISLDTLNQDRFESITGSNSLIQALRGIEMVKALGFDTVKVNVVVMKGVNDDEVQDFVRFGLENNLIVRFIEFMQITPLWDHKFFVPIETIKEICQRMFGFRRIEYRSSGPAEYYKYSDSLIGFIKTSHENCQICSRLRLTAMGELKSCLYQSNGLSLRDLLREGASFNQLKDSVDRVVIAKGDINYTSWDESEIFMYSVGG